MKCVMELRENRMCDLLVCVPFFHACFYAMLLCMLLCNAFPLEIRVKKSVCKDATQYRKELTFPLLHQALLSSLTSLSPRLLVFMTISMKFVPQPSYFPRKHNLIWQRMISWRNLWEVVRRKQTPQRVISVILVASSETICCIRFILNVCEVSAEECLCQAFCSP